MIINRAGTVLSVRSITFDGATILEGQRRGSDIIKIHYQILTQKPNETKGVLEWTVVKDHTSIINGEFGDAELGEVIGYVKAFAVKAISEMHKDEESDIDTAINKINKDQAKNTGSEN